MGPAKGTRIINKPVIKGCVGQQHPEDPHSSSKSKQKKRKIADLDPIWSKAELTHFYEAYRLHGKDWKKISLAVGSKPADMVQSLYSIHRTFLSLPEHQATATGFIALVTGHRYVSDESTSCRGVDQTVRAYGKARKRGDATVQKANERAEQDHSCHDRTISGFSSSFKKRYYGELVRKSQIAVGRRTPRTPVTVPADTNVTDVDMPKFENVNNSTKNTAEEIKDGCMNFPMDEFSPYGSSGIAKADKADQGQTFLGAKGAGDAEVYHSQHLKKRKIQQITDEEVGMGKVEYGTMMEAKEGIKLTDSLQQQTLNDFFSEDDMLVLDVLQSLVNAPSKTSKLKINIHSGSLGKTYSALSHKLEEGHSPVDLSKQAKEVHNCSAPRTRQKRHKKILDADVAGKEQNISFVNLVPQPEVHTDGITKVSSCSESKGVMPETSANTSGEVDSSITVGVSPTLFASKNVDPSAPAKIKPEIKMSRRTKRKMELHCKTKEYVPCKFTEGSDNLQTRKLQHCLSSESLRRWCGHEWFYSAVDYPWFSDNEFVSYLNHAKLRHIRRLTRSEWSTIRSSLGKPRRFSDHLLAIEREKLEDYRKNVRKIYAQLSDGSRDSLPADLARPFSIGQQVIVRHPSSRELCDGKVVMMGQDFYKVHISNPGLGVNIVKDTDCMPVDWSDNLPENMRRSYLSNNAQSVLEMGHIPNLVPSENFDHTTKGVYVIEWPRSMHLNPDEQLKFTVNGERPPNDGLLPRGCLDKKIGHSDELESYVTSFVLRSLSQARQLVDEAMQANSGDEEVATSNQTTDFIGRESEAAIHDDRFPSHLISNCIATIISIKQLSDSRHPPANIAGVLERASSMLRPSCPDNLAVYKEIESYLSVIANQLLALVPTLGCGPSCRPCN